MHGIFDWEGAVLKVALLLLFLLDILEKKFNLIPRQQEQEQQQ